MHLTPEDDALVQGLLDGSLQPAEREAAERLVQANAEARRRSAELAELARLLDGLGPAEPPVNFSARVMQAVADAHVHAKTNRTLEASGQRLTFSERLSQLIDGGFGMGKKVMWGMVATAFVALVVMKVVGYPPIDGAEGTVGAAKRYQAEQLKPTDVQVDDSAQAFLQTDTFDHLMKDADAREILSSPSFRVALANADFSRALASPDLVKQLSSPDLVKALASPDLMKSLSSPDLLKSLSSPSLVHALSNADFVKALASPDLMKALASPDFAKALSSPGFSKALASPDFVKALSSPGFSKALSSPQLAQALASNLR